MMNENLEACSWRINAYILNNMNHFSVGTLDRLTTGIKLKILSFRYPTIGHEGLPQMTTFSPQNMAPRLVRIEVFGIRTSE